MVLSQVIGGRRTAIAVLVAVAVVGGLLLVATPHARATSDAKQDRLAGADRFETAAAIATAAYPNGATTAVVASGRAYPDALAGAALAGLKAAPLLLTEPTSVPTATSNALKSLGVKKVYVLGGTSAVSSGVSTTLAQDYSVTRLAGSDRYETTKAIANEIGASNVAVLSAKRTAIIATGLDFADALAGGPLAAAGANHVGVYPILLVNDDVPAATNDALTSLGIQQVVLLGGTTAVSSSVQAKLETKTGNPAIRLGGVNRFDTAAKIADAAKTSFGFPLTKVLLANGFGFADALAGGPLGGVRQAPILLTDPSTLSTETANWIIANRSTVASVTALGGTSAVSQTVLDQAQQDAKPPAPSHTNETLTVAPVTAATQTNGTTRDYTVTKLGTTSVDIALVPCSNITTDSTGNTQFFNSDNDTVADGTQKAPAPGAPTDSDSTASSTSSISMVNGTATPTASSWTGPVTPTSGTVTFQVTGPSSLTTVPSCVVPLVFVDANLDNGLNGSTANPMLPTEAFATGGATTFTPTGSPSGSFNVKVTSATPSTNTFTGCTLTSTTPEVVNSNACGTFVYKTGDGFQLSQPSPTPISMAEFQRRLSPDDYVQGTYAPSGQSTFLLTNRAPLAPTNLTATRSATTPTSVTVSFSQSSTASVSGYRVYRAQAASPCPKYVDSPGSYGLLTAPPVPKPATSVAMVTYTDTAATASLAYCYVATAVDTLDESPATDPPAAVSSVPMFSSATFPTNRMTITLKYNVAVSCSSIDPDGSDYKVVAGGTTVTSPPPYTAACAAPGTSSDTVTLTFPAPLAAGTITVTAKNGTDGNTVTDAGGVLTQPVGDNITATASP